MSRASAGAALGHAHVAVRSRSAARFVARRALVYGLVLVVAVWLIAPFAWLFVTSVSYQKHLLARPLSFIPPEVTLIPNYIAMQRLGWYNTYVALIVPFGASVFNVFLLRQAFLQLPGELYEAAVLEGCTHLRFLWQFAVPLSRPVLAIIALLTAIRAWNDFQWPLIVTDTPDLRPIQVGLTIFRSDVSTNFQLLMAGSMMAVLPVVVLYLVTQRQFIQGIALTGLKA